MVDMGFSFTQRTIKMGSHDGWHITPDARREWVSLESRLILIRHRQPVRLTPGQPQVCQELLDHFSPGTVVQVGIGVDVLAIVLLHLLWIGAALPSFLSVVQVYVTGC